MSIDKQKLSILSIPAAVAANMLIAYTLMMLCRIIFVWINIDFYPDLTLSHFLQMAGGGLMFDTSGLLYGNALYLLLVLLPCHIKENRRYHNALRWLFVVVNMLYVAINLIDSVYFRFSGRRTTMSVFSQFSNESNLGSIIAQEALSHWYLVLIAIFLGWAVFRLYRFPKPDWKGNKVAYYIVSTLVLAIVAPFIVFGMRGGIGRDVRPITISNANTYVNKPIETAIVLNTPFSMLRTIGKKPFVTPPFTPRSTSPATASSRIARMWWCSCWRVSARSISARSTSTSTAGNTAATRRFSIASSRRAWSLTTLLPMGSRASTDFHRCCRGFHDL